MKFFDIKRLAGGKGRFLPAFSREQYIMGGCVLYFLIALTLLGYDAAIFYQDVLNRAAGAPPFSSQSRFSERDIDEVITLLDEREKKFNEILLKSQ